VAGGCRRGAGIEMGEPLQKECVGRRQGWWPMTEHEGRCRYAVWQDYGRALAQRSRGATLADWRKKDWHVGQRGERGS
jgi:hypothetical protein